MSSQHKLFAVGKSIVGLSGDGGRYRMSKNSGLPRFGNPGSDESQPVGRFRRWWRALRAWRPWRKRVAAAASSVEAGAAERKAGPSLSDVKVVRNDLSDSGMEVLSLRRPATVKSGASAVKTVDSRESIPVGTAAPR